MTDATHHQPDDDEVLALENVCVAAGERLRKLIHANRMSASRALKTGKPAGFIVTRNRQFILKLAANGYAPDEIAVELQAIAPHVSATDFAAAISRLFAREARRQSSNHAAMAGAPPNTQGPIGDAQPPQNGAAPERTGNATSNTDGTRLTAKTATAAVVAGLVPAPDEAHFRTQSPYWCDGRYDYDCLKRDSDETDTDYFYRMWHTAPPWASEIKPKARETDTDFARRCWAKKSPEERAEHQRNLPPTAR